MLRDGCHSYTCPVRGSIVCKNPFSFLATFRVLQKRENQNQNNDFGKNHRATLHIFWILNLYGNETV